MTPVLAPSTTSPLSGRVLIRSASAPAQLGAIRDQQPVAPVDKVRRAEDETLPKLGSIGVERLVKSNADDASGQLSAAEQKIVEKLAARDKEVRNHENAHAIVGGRYAAAPVYEYTTGPDGKRYAVSGAVTIDAAPVKGDPEATIAKMETVKAAALAPAEPSGADRQVAARAEALRLEALAELQAERLRAAFGDGESSGEAAPAPGTDVIAKEPEEPFEFWFRNTLEEMVKIVGPEPFGQRDDAVDFRA